MFLSILHRRKVGEHTYTHVFDVLGVQISFKAFLIKFNIYLFRNENTLIH